MKIIPVSKTSFQHYKITGKWDGLSESVKNPISYTFLLDQNKIVGSMIYSIRMIRDEMVAKLIDIEVHNQYRRQGYGKKAVRSLIDQAKEAQVSYIQLFVFHHRRPAKSLYDNLGFEVIQVRSNGWMMRYRFDT